MFAGLAGLAAAWLLPGTGDPEELRLARGRQGLLAGSVAGAVCGLLLTNLFAVAVVMMVTGPLFVPFLTKSGRTPLTSGATPMLT